MSTQSLTTQSVSSGKNVLAAPRRAGSLTARVVATLLEWRRRIRSRHELAMLSALELKDIGHPARLEAEKSKPFWRA